MDLARAILNFARAYSVTLVVIAVLTVVWVTNPDLGESPTVAGMWFAIGGFGVLVAIMIGLVHFTRRNRKNRKQRQ